MSQRKEASILKYHSNFIHTHRPLTRFIYTDYKHNNKVARNEIHRLTNEVFTLSLIVCNNHKTSTKKRTALVSTLALNIPRHHVPSLSNTNTSCNCIDAVGWLYRYNRCSQHFLLIVHVASEVFLTNSDNTNLLPVWHQPIIPTWKTKDSAKTMTSLVKKILVSILN